MLDWLLAFFVTCLLELPLVAVGTRDLGLPAKQRLLVALAGQALTHPLVWFVFPKLHGDRELWFWVSEVFAVVVEAVLYARALRGLGTLRAFGISALANALSLGAGVAWNAFAR